MSNTNIFKAFDDFDGRNQKILQKHENVFPSFPSLKAVQTDLVDVDASKSIGKTIRGMTFVSSILAQRPIPGNSISTKGLYFIDATKIEYNNIEIIVDAGTDPDEPKITEHDFYYYPETENKKFAYHVRIFVSTSAKKLEEAYKNTSADEHELLIFVEDNSTDKTKFIYGAVTVGSKLKENLLSTYENHVIENSNLISVILEAFKKETRYSLEENFVKGLLKNGKAEYPALKTISTVFTIIDFFAFGTITEASNYGISMLLDEAIEFINEGKIEDHRWNPKAEKPFDPKFYPMALEQELDRLDHKELNEKIRSVIGDLTKDLKGYDSYFSKLLNVSTDTKKDNVDRALKDIVYDAFRQIYQKCESIIINLENIDVSDVLKTGIRAWNAFICGVWNSLVDAVTSLLDMVKMLINFSTSSKELIKNLETHLPRLVERVEEALQAWEKLDFKKCTLYFMKKMTESSFGFSAEQFAYYVGFAYGFIISLIIEIVIGILLTGGVLSVEEIARRLAQELFRFFTSFANGVRKTWKKGSQLAKKTIDGFISGLDALIDFLKQGWEGIKKWIDEAFDSIEKLAKVKIDEFIKKLPKKIAIFINILPVNFQKKIANGLLEVYFNNRKLLILDPRGIITEIEFIRVLKPGTSIVSEIKGAELRLIFFDNLGNRTTKKYIDDLQVIITKTSSGVDRFGFNPKFIEGKSHDADFINQTFKRTENIRYENEIVFGNPPYKTSPANKAKVLDKVLKGGDEFYIVEYKTQGKPGNFVSDYEVKNIKELREKLAVKKAWKNEDNGALVVRKYKVKAGKEIRTREGYIGEMLEDTKGSPYYGKILEGGPKQWEVVDGWDNDFTNLIEKIYENPIQ